MADSTANSSDNLADAGNPHEGLKDMDMDLQLQDFSVEAIVSKLDELKKMFEQDICGPLLEKAKQVVKESEEFEQEKARHRDPKASMEDIVKLDIGGKFFDITRRDLCRVEDSRLAKIFNGDFKIMVAEKTQRTFLDRDYTHFHIIEAYLKQQDYESLLPTDPLDIKRLAHECEYYQLKELQEKVEAQKDVGKRK
jgi:hypothetical protein